MNVNVNVNVNRSQCELLPSWKSLSFARCGCVGAPFCKWISFPHSAVIFLHVISPRRMHEKYRHCKVSMKNEDEKRRIGNGRATTRPHVNFRNFHSVCDHCHSCRWLPVVSKSLRIDSENVSRLSLWSKVIWVYDTPNDDECWRKRNRRNLNANGTSTKRKEKFHWKYLTHFHTCEHKKQ